MHATTSDDGGDITRTLIELVSPGTPVLAAYRETYPAPTNALTRMVRGASSIEQILAKTAVHFATLPPEGAAIMPEFIMHMYLLAKAQQPAFIPKFWRSSGLWAHLFATMRKAAKEAPLGALQEFPWDSFFLPVLGVAGDIFSDCWENDRSETYSLLALWVRTDFFGAIDAALPRCVTHVRVTSTYLIIFLYRYHSPACVLQGSCAAFSLTCMGCWKTLRSLSSYVQSSLVRAHCARLLNKRLLLMDSHERRLDHAL